MYVTSVEELKEFLSLKGIVWSTETSPILVSYTYTYTYTHARTHAQINWL